MKLFTRLLAPLLLPLFIGGCGNPPAIYQQQILALGTLVDVTLYNVDEKQGRQAAALVTEEMERIHHNWHAWEPSKLTDINQRLAKGETVTLDETGLRLITTAIRLSRQSGGLFNPGAGSLIGLWGFHSDERTDSHPPAPDKIAALLQPPLDMADLHLTGTKLSSANPHLQLDLGGYAKGYAVDQAIDLLRRQGINNAIVNAGGDLRAIGAKGDRPWRIGIRDPRGPGVLASLSTSGDESIFTSGDYERYFTYEGKRYHHIIDPRDGYPARGFSSVTVIHQDATTADAAATALMIAGPDRWQEVRQAMGLQQVMAIDMNNTAYLTRAMADRIHFEIEPAPKTVIVP